MEWESYWDNLIEKKKLRPRLDELDELDKARCNPYTTEQICHKIYDCLLYTSPSPRDA